MSEIRVQPLAEDDWEQYRAVRLSALQESPEAFVATYKEESGYDEARWRSRMIRSQRLLADQDESVVGVVCVGKGANGEMVAMAELFGLWVAPAARGSGVASALVQAGAEHARSQGKSHLAYWVGTDNGRAVAFASGFGFRPTDDRRPMRVRSVQDGEEEIAMVLALTDDRI